MDTYDILLRDRWVDDGGQSPPDMGEEHFGLNPKRILAIAEPSVYDVLADHQTRHTDGWLLRQWIQDLHRWKAIFEAELGLDVGDVVVRLANLRRKCLGWFYGPFNDFGVQREIAIDRHHLLTAPPWDVIGTWLHELLHAWEQRHGKPGKHNYHTTALRAKALSFGLIIDANGGQDYVPDGVFFKILEKHASDLPSPKIESASVVGPARQSKLKKWTCACTNVRVAVADFRAKCLNCHREFIRGS